MGGLSPHRLLVLIGTAELCLAIWILAGRSRKSCAIVQTLTLIAMNAAGLIWARENIADAGGMVLQNIAFIAFVWSNALAGERNDDRSRH
jgi:hypothetical protein